MVVLAVCDGDASARFCANRLGVTEEFRADGRASLSRGTCRLRLGHCPDATPMPRVPAHSWFAYPRARVLPAATTTASPAGWRSGTRWPASRGVRGSSPSSRRTGAGSCSGKRFRTPNQPLDQAAGDVWQQRATGDPPPISPAWQRGTWLRADDAYGRLHRPPRRAEAER